MTDRADGQLHRRLLSCPCNRLNGGQSRNAGPQSATGRKSCCICASFGALRRYWRWRCSGAAAMAQGADDWPNRTVRIIVNFGPGGSADNSMRPFADRLSRALGQQFVIENRGGASGALGLEAAVKSPPDGYTFVVTPSLSVVILPHLRKTPLRSAQGPRARHPVHGRHAAVRRAPLPARQFAAGAGGLRQGQPRQAELGHGRRRLVRPSHVRGLQAADGHRHPARALSRWRASCSPTSWPASCRSMPIPTPCRTCRPARPSCSPCSTATGDRTSPTFRCSRKSTRSSTSWSGSRCSLRPARRQPSCAR